MSATVDLTAWSNLPARALLFGEAQGRVVVSTANPAAVAGESPRAHGVPARRIGVVEPADRPFRIRLRRRVSSPRPFDRLADAYHAGDSIAS